MPSKQVLGKGLSALLPGAAPTEEAEIKSEKIENSPASPEVKVPTKLAIYNGGVRTVDIETIQANEFQPRRSFDDETLKELSQSIRIQGVLQPLLVRPSQSGYELIAGERRLRASKLAGLKEVPVVVRPSTDRESLELALIENLQREDLNCLDESMSYFSLIEDFGLTQEGVATRVGKDRASVANSIRLLRLPQEIRDDLKNGLLSAGHGKALLGLMGVMDHQEIVKFRDEIIKNALSVREVERKVSQIKSQSGQSSKKAKKSLMDDPAWRAVRDRLEKNLGTKIDIKGSQKKGKIVLEYYSLQDFNRLVDRLTPSM